MESRSEMPNEARAANDQESLSFNRGQSSNLFNSNSSDFSQSQDRIKRPDSIFYPRQNSEIEISSIEIASSIFTKHVKYQISGEDSYGKFQNHRRYKEFLSLRNALITQWPGCSVPQIPPKQAIGNLHSQFIENRRKLFEYFLREIAKVTYLYTCEETQSFLRGPAEFHKSDLATRSADYKRISERFKKYFPDYVLFERTPEIEKEISLILGHLNNGFSNLSKICNQCHENSLIMKNLDSHLLKFIHIVKDTQKYYSEEASEFNVAQQFEDPYLELNSWARNNILSISGFIEGIYKQYEIQKHKNSIFGKIEEEKKNIENLKKGKKKMVQYFNKKSNEFYIGRSEAEIIHFHELIDDLDRILNISAALIVYEDYPNFRKAKKNDFNVCLNGSYKKHLETFENFKKYLADLDLKSNEI